MKLLVIDNYDSFTWNLVHYLEEIFPGDITVMRNDAFSATEALDYEALVISPGPGLPSESGNLMEVLRLCAATKPILGVCLGLQAITEHFGGKLIQLPQVMHGLQRECRILQSDLLFTDIASPFMAGRYHSWAADPQHFPSCLEVVAVDELNTIMAIRHEHLPIHAVQFHPESIMTPEGKKMMRNWVGALRLALRA